MTSQPWRGLSLWQPHASAIPAGLKAFETRSWSTSYRGTVAIHAGLKTFEGLISLKQELLARWDADDPRVEHSIIDMPHGCMVAVADLVAVHRTEDCHAGNGIYVSATERRWGDWSPGRFAWQLENIRPIDPVPWQGKQGLWKLTDDEMAVLEIEVDIAKEAAALKVIIERTA